MCIGSGFCVSVTAALEPNDNGGGCGHDMKPEHCASKRRKEPKGGELVVEEGEVGVGGEREGSRQENEKKKGEGRKKGRGRKQDLSTERYEGRQARQREGREEESVKWSLIVSRIDRKRKRITMCECVSIQQAS